MHPIPVDVWSDIACPWCYVGKRHLERAVESAGATVAVTWHAFELDPAASRNQDASVSYVERLARKYGVSETEAQGMIDRMVGVGAAVGLDFRFDRVRPTNTFDAHRLLAWARRGGAEAQGRMKEVLCRAYMTEGEQLGDVETLKALSSRAELDPVEAADVLESGALSDEVRRDEADAQRLGISGVPFFVIGGRFGLSGAQPPEVIAAAIQRASDEGPG